MFNLIRVKYAGKCSTCGGTIPRGALAIWHRETRTLEHDSESVACSLRRKSNIAHVSDGRLPPAAPEDPNNSFDMRVEDQMAEVCGFSPFGPPE